MKVRDSHPAHRANRGYVDLRAKLELEQVPGQRDIAQLGGAERSHRHSRGARGVGHRARGKDLPTCGLTRYSGGEVDGGAEEATVSFDRWALVIPARAIGKSLPVVAALSKPPTIGLPRAEGQSLRRRVLSAGRLRCGRGRPEPA